METCKTFLAKEKLPSHKNILAKVLKLIAFLIISESSHVMARPVVRFKEFSKNKLVKEKLLNKTYKI